MAGSLSSANAGDPAVARRRAPPPPARAPLPSHMRTWPAAGSGANDPDQRGRGSNPARNGQAGALLLKRPPVSYLLHVGPSTLIDSFNSVLNFRFKPLSLLEFHTQVPEDPFYDLNLLFLSIITF
jgi:hypothetical protein